MTLASVSRTTSEGYQQNRLSLVFDNVSNQNHDKVVTFFALPQLFALSFCRNFRNAPQYFSEKFDRLNPDIIGLQWKGKSPGTYMWHMILEDIREKYIPGTGKLRAIVITDGLDTHSPSPYRGISGMNPMMQQLLEEGFDIEWHIVVVSIANVWASISTADISKYEALAETTGGGFLHIDQPGVMNDYSARHFLSTLEKAVTGNARSTLDTTDFQHQQGKGARFLSRLHQSNQHLEDQQADERRRQQQLEQYKRKQMNSGMTWLPLLESTRKGKK